MHIFKAHALWFQGLSDLVPWVNPYLVMRYFRTVSSVAGNSLGLTETILDVNWTPDQCPWTVAALRFHTRFVGLVAGCFLGWGMKKQSGSVYAVQLGSWEGRLWRREGKGEARADLSLSSYSSNEGGGDGSPGSPWGRYQEKNRWIDSLNLC